MTKKERQYINDDDTGGKKIGTTEAIMSMLKCNVGVGLISMPYFLAKAGVFFGLCFFLFTMILTFLALKRLDRLRQIATVERRSKDKHLSFLYIVDHFLGHRAHILALSCIVISSVGCCIAYVEFVATTLSDFVWESNLYALCLIPLLSFLSMFDKLSVLARFGGVGLLFTVCFCLIVVSTSVVSRESRDHIVDFGSDFFDVKWKTLPLASGLAVFCNEGIVVMSTKVAESMRRPDHFLYAAKWTMVVFTILYLAVAISGDLRYYGNVEDQISKNFKRADAVDKVAAIAYCVQLLPTFPLVLWMVYTHYEDYWETCVGIERFPSRAYRIMIRIIIVVFVCVMAMFLKGFGQLLAVIGSACNSVLIYILPFASHIVATRGDRKRRRGMIVDGSVTRENVDVEHNARALLAAEVVVERDDTMSIDAKSANANDVGGGVAVSACIIAFGVVSGIIGTVQSAAELAKKNA